MADLLTIDALSAGYGKATVLYNVSLSVEQGTALALLGRNGVGKTTTLNTIVGLTRYQTGSIKLGGTSIERMAPERRVEAGVGWVPQERGVFRSLTVEENITAVARPGRWTLQAVYELSHGFRSVARTSATSFQVASNRCCQSPVHLSSTLGSCC